MSDWPIGRHLKNGRYEIEARIGIGGFGITYRARDLRDGGWVAIKALNSATQNHPEFDRLQERFVNEAIALASCRHPHVVRVYPQLFQEAGLWCMVMECVVGESLSDRCQRLGPLPVEMALAIVDNVGGALEFVHQQGFLHRDVKPQNILLRATTDSPVLIDFGLAREYRPGQLDELTSHFTDCFAPPEQYSRIGRHGTWTDVYALAATLYVILTAELPVPSRFRRQGAPLVQPSGHNPAIAPWLDRAIVLGMALEPEERPQTIANWLSYLHPTVELPPLPPSALNLAGSCLVAGDKAAPNATQQQSKPPPVLARYPNRPASRAMPLEVAERAKTNWQEELTQLNAEPSASKEGAAANGKLSPLTRTTDIESATFDYGTLRRCLEAEDWAAAHEETYQLMLCLVGRSQAGWFRVEDLAAFPCGDLRAIDRLWLECSDGQFGFSVQERIYRTLSGDRYNPDAWKALGDRLGWRVNGDWQDETGLTFARQAPPGHLPGWILRSEYRGGGLVVFSALVSRLRECDRC